MVLHDYLAGKSIYAHHITAYPSGFEKLAALIHKNIIEMFARCNIYEIRIIVYCAVLVSTNLFVMLCVSNEHLHNLDKRVSWLILFYFRVDSLFSTNQIQVKFIKLYNPKIVVTNLDCM